MDETIRSHDVIAAVRRVGLFSSQRMLRILRMASKSIAARHLAFLMLSQPPARSR